MSEAMGKLRDVEVDVDATGMGSIIVDGKDMSMLVSGIEFRSTPGDMTELELRLSCLDVTMKSEARVRIVVGGQEFSTEDVELLGDVLHGQEKDADAVQDLRGRLAAILPPRRLRTPDPDDSG